MGTEIYATENNQINHGNEQPTGRENYILGIERQDNNTYEPRGMIGEDFDGYFRPTKSFSRKIDLLGCVCVAA